MTKEQKDVEQKLKREFLFYDMKTNIGTSKVISIDYNHSIQPAMLSCANGVNVMLSLNKTIQ